jgi:hypothetical protein
MLRVHWHGDDPVADQLRAAAAHPPVSIVSIDGRSA